MARCLVCGNRSKGTRLTKITEHHYFHRSKHKHMRSNNFTQKVCGSCHNQGPNSYHSVFRRNCEDLGCQDPRCKFAPICYLFRESFG